MPLLEQAARRGDVQLFRFALQQAVQASRFDSREGEIRDSLTPILASMQSPPSCELELQREGLDEQRPYTVDTWRRDRLHAALHQQAVTRLTGWMDACLPGVLSGLTQTDHAQCMTWLTRLANQEGPFIDRQPILQHLLHLTLDTPDHAAWVSRARWHAWAMQATMGPVMAGPGGGGQTRSVPLRELWNAEMWCGSWQRMDGGRRRARSIRPDGGTGRAPAP